MKLIVRCIFPSLLLTSIVPAQQQPIPVNQNPGASQTIVQPLNPMGVPTMFSVNRFETIRYAEQFASGSSTGGIQEAISDLGPNGGEVVLPAGPTTVTSTIHIKTPILLRGHGMGGFSVLGSGISFSTPSTIVSQIPTGDVISVEAPTPPSGCNPSNPSGLIPELDGVVLEDFQVSGRGKNGGQGVGCGIHFVGGNNCNPMRKVSINRVFSNNNTDCGLEVSDLVFQISIINSQFTFNNIDGIRLITTNVNGQVSQVTLHDVTTDLNGRDGLRIEQNVGDVSVFGGTFADSGQNGLGVYNSSPSTIPGASVKVFGAHFESNTNGGISIGGGSGHVIQGNVIVTTANTGIAIWTPTSQVGAIIEGNVLSGNHLDIYVDPASQNVLIGPQASVNYTVLNDGPSTARVAVVPF